MLIIGGIRASPPGNIRTGTTVSTRSRTTIGTTGAVAEAEGKTTRGTRTLGPTTTGGIMEGAAATRIRECPVVTASGHREDTVLLILLLPLRYPLPKCPRCPQVATRTALWPTARIRDTATPGGGKTTSRVTTGGRMTGHRLRTRLRSMPERVLRLTLVWEMFFPVAYLLSLLHQGQLYPSVKELTDGTRRIFGVSRLCLCIV